MRVFRGKGMRGLTRLVFFFLNNYEFTPIKTYSKLKIKIKIMIIIVNIYFSQITKFTQIPN